MGIGLPCQVALMFLYCASPTLGAVDVLLYSLEKSEEGISLSDGIIEVQPKVKFRLAVWWTVAPDPSARLFASFTRRVGFKGQKCNDLRTTDVLPISILRNESYGILDVRFQESQGGLYYMCTKEARANVTDEWVHQGVGKYLTIKLHPEAFELPVWIRIIFIVILLSLSAMFSGLNLGLMSLDPTELKIVLNSGSPKQRGYAKKIMPVRRHGNFLLCTLLLGNTLVNSSLTIILDSLTSGIVAVVGATLAIVLFGEIIPQSICSRYGLAVGAYTVWLTKVFMVITFPLSFPISKILDLILGKELGTIYNKRQLLEMLKLQEDYNDLERDELAIMSGALKYGSKTVGEVMTPLEDCFMLDEETVLDFQTLSDIVKSGFSRIPIYSGERSNIVALLFVKDLAFIDPDDCIPLLSLIKFYKHPVHKTFSDTTLDKMLEEFKRGTTHLSVVIKVDDSDPEKDPVYACVGIVTLEDVIEEIIQDEIVDETDVYVDNVSGKKVPGRKHRIEDMCMFLPSPQMLPAKISPHMAFAIYQYLSTAVKAFTEELISRNVLKKVIAHPGVIEEKQFDADAKGSKQDPIYLYKKGQAADYFILILQGRVEVTIGHESIVFEDGPFSAFGLNALLMDSSSPFVPDYDIKLLTTVLCMKVKRSLYRSAVRATQMERDNKTPDQYQEFDEIFWPKTVDVHKAELPAEKAKSGGGGVAEKNGHAEKTVHLDDVIDRDQASVPLIAAMDESNMDDMGNNSK